MEFKNLLSQPTLLVTIFALLLLLFVLTSISRRNRSTVSRKAAPEAKGAWPLIGHLHLLSGSLSPHVILGNMAEKYGPVFTMRLGVHQTLIVSNSDMAKECFTINDRAFATRPKSLAFEILGYNFSAVGFSLYGSYWRQVRKITTLELLSSRRIDSLKHVIEWEVMAAMKESYNLMSKDSGKVVVTEMKKWFGDITHNFLFRIIVGKRFNEGEEENERIQKAIREFLLLSGSFVVSDALPYLRWLDLDGKEKEMKRTAKELDEFTQLWLDQHKRNRHSGEGELKGKQDFMDVLLSVLDQGREFDDHDTDTAVKATCLALIVAGTDTTTGTMTWALSLLLNNQEVLKKVVHELDTNIDKNSLVVESDLKNLVYLQATIKETLRLYPAAPLNLPHESMEDCTVGGYHVPAGTRLLTNIYKLQRDPLIYDDPLEFRPERFVTTHKDIDLRGQHFELIPFGAGRRMCPGMSLALQVMQLTLANLLHGFDVVTCDGRQVDMHEIIGLTNIKASPLQVILTPRLTPQVYNQN